jgi:heterogeneous nuclear ribonucleoprotein U-like protein 1
MCIDHVFVYVCFFLVDSDLNLKINRETFCSAISLSDTGLALVWGGARANYGAINNGKYFYEMQIIQYNTKISYPNEKNLHEIRCGWSTANSSLQLGESEFSYGFDSSGRKCNSSEFTDYGPKLNVNDVVGIHLEISEDKCTIHYNVNGKDFGVAFEFEKGILNNEALFPHISTKNIEYQINFGHSDSSLWSLRRDAYKTSELQRRRIELEQKKKEVEKKREEKLKKEAAEPVEQKDDEEKPAEDAQEPEKKEIVEDENEEEMLPEEITEAEVDSDTPFENCLPGYNYIGHYPIESLSKGPRRPEARTDCEVIMMIGLPGAGKSHWALERAKEFPEKRYTLLGTKYLLERMKISGQARKPQSQPGRWEKLIELCNRGLLTLNEIACKRRRNFILDYPHVYISDQRRKMRVYGDFKRIAAIVVPTEEEFKRRCKQRLETEGKDIPDAAVNEMRANITLPELEYQWFNEILYTDLEREAAHEEVLKENERGKRALNQRGRNDFNRGRDFNNRNDRRWGGPQRNDFRRNDRWGPQSGGPQRQGMGQGFRRDFPARNNWGNNDNWMMGRSRGGYGGVPPPRPGKRQPDNRPQQNRNDRRDFRQGGNSNNGNNNRNDRNRRQDGQKKFGGGKSDWNSQGGGAGPWSGNNNWNNYG